MTERYPYQKNWEDLRFRQALPFLAIFLWIFFLFVFAVVGTLCRDGYRNDLACLGSLVFWSFSRLVDLRVVILSGVEMSRLQEILFC